MPRMFSKEVITHCPICSELLQIKDESKTCFYYRYKCEGDESHDYRLMNCTLPHTEYIEEYRLGKYHVHNDSDIFSNVEVNGKEIMRMIDNFSYIPVFQDQDDLEDWLEI